MSEYFYLMKMMWSLKILEKNPLVLKMLLDDAFSENKYYQLQVNIWFVGEDDCVWAIMFSISFWVAVLINTDSALLTTEGFWAQEKSVYYIK